jgi:hypothetical protein
MDAFKEYTADAYIYIDEEKNWPAAILDDSRVMELLE